MVHVSVLAFTCTISLPAALSEYLPETKGMANESGVLYPRPLKENSGLLEELQFFRPSALKILAE